MVLQPHGVLTSIEETLRHDIEIVSELETTTAVKLTING
jgi:hypothetical protein